MSSNRIDVWSGIGAIASSILSVYAWLYSIGLVPLFTFITGALFTLWTQERLEKKRQKQEIQNQHIKKCVGQKRTIDIEKGFPVVNPRRNQYKDKA